MIDEKGEKHWVGSDTSSKECKDILELVEKAIQQKDDYSKNLEDPICEKNSQEDDDIEK